MTIEKAYQLFDELERDKTIQNFIAQARAKYILLESNEDVREQFYVIYQKLKDTAGDKEFEDLKVLQTLLDSSSRTKRTGADKWWR